MEDLTRQMDLTYKVRRKKPKKDKNRMKKSNKTYL